MAFDPVQPEPYYAPGWHPPRAPLDRWSVASVVAGALMTGPVAIALGVIGLRRTRAHGSRGGRLALVGIGLGVVGSLAIAAVAVGVQLTAAATRPLPLDVDAPRDAQAVQLVTGHCVDPLPAGGDVDDVTVTPCDQPHAAQVVTEYRFDRAAVWPGQQAADRRVWAACTLTPDEVAAGVRAVAWAPTEQSWKRGDRTGLCLATVDGGGLTGSFLDGSVILP
ncbi:septum formation family protein [Cellulomonas cellasea]|uniref:DUF4190 domain-containing protein n=1 Tax=Cellulomonas cellasea TaxID=43670 RepID=UPI0025A31FCB|nr:DUF4190 domain-containing protein [Cellulomonas cellasea]MDM8084337.1 septum formation family protein [Cellulomonas cellasea]